MYRTVFILFSCLLTSFALADEVPKARIARFPGDRAAAITYTFDDNIRDQYKVNTFANVARYEKERNDAKLEISPAGKTLKLTIQSSLDPKLFDVPLTIIVDAPAAKSVRVERAGKELTSRLQNGSIYFDAPPSADTITIEWK